MPSIPQSLLWISLVVLWLFVLVPMLISKRDAVRRTSDVALATRVLNGGAGARLLKRTGPAAGHRSDPDWKPEDEWENEPVDGAFADADTDHNLPEQEDEDTDAVARPRSVVTAMAKTDKTGEVAEGPDYLDVDVIEDPGALPVGASARGLLAVEDDKGEHAEADADADHELAADEYEYVEDSSGLEPGEDSDDDRDDDRDYHRDDYDVPAYTAGVSRRRRLDNNKTATAVSARKYAFRKKVLVAMAAILIGSAVSAFEVTSMAWWLCGIATTITVLYLGYLRRQTKIEERVRRRRMQRLARARMGVENTEDREYDLVPSRLRRPGAVVLEIDEEDPIFEHLDYAVPMRNYGWSRDLPRDLPRAVGQ